MTTTADIRKPYHLKARVYYADTDAGGVVYHANFLQFAERARCEYWRQLPVDFLTMVRHIDIDFLAPAKLDDLLDISAEIVACGNTSITFKQIVSRDEKKLAEMTIIMVAVSEIGKATRIPPQLRQIFGGE